MSVSCCFHSPHGVTSGRGQIDQSSMAAVWEANKLSAATGGPEAEAATRKLGGRRRPGRGPRA